MPDAVDIALQNLRAGGREVERAERQRAAAALRVDPAAPDWGGVLQAAELERHVKAEQAERERNLQAALYEESVRRAAGPRRWRPTAFLEEFAAWTADEHVAHALAGAHQLPRTQVFTMIRDRDFRAATISTASYPEPVSRLQPFEPAPGPQILLVDLIDWRPVETELPEFMLETLRDEVAAETAETVAAPESGFNFTPQAAFCKWIPVVVPARMAALQDSEELEGIIAGQLTYILRERLQGEVVAGDGDPGASDGNLCGLTNWPGVGSVTLDAGSTQPQLDAISSAMASVAVNTRTWYRATTMLINPADAVQLRQIKDQADRPVFPVDRPLSPFGLTTIETADAPLGEPLVGDPAAIAGFLRGDVTVEISQTHADFFTRHMVMFKAMGRFGMALRQPAAWCAIEGFNS